MSLLSLGMALVWAALLIRTLVQTHTRRQPPSRPVWGG
jgi:hypothetical protein